MSVPPSPSKQHSSSTHQLPNMATTRFFIRLLQICLAMFGFQFVYTTPNYLMLHQFGMHPILIVLGGLAMLTSVLAGWSAYSVLYYPQVVQKKLRLSLRGFVGVEALIDSLSLVAYGVACYRFSHMVHSSSQECFQGFSVQDCMKLGNTSLYATFSCVPISASLLIGLHGFISLPSQAKKKKSSSVINSSAADNVEKSVKVN